MAAKRTAGVPRDAGRAGTTPSSTPRDEDTSEVARIPLYRGGKVAAYAIVDAADAQRISETRWRLSSRGYAVHGHDAEGMHRIVLELQAGDGKTVDHENDDPLDNRRSNLRVVEHGFNIRRAMGDVGASFHAATGRWQARYRGRTLGYFADEDTARREVRRAAARDEIAQVQR